MRGQRGETWGGEKPVALLPEAPLPGHHGGGCLLAPQLPTCHCSKEKGLKKIEFPFHSCGIELGSSFSIYAFMLEVLLAAAREFVINMNVMAHG